MLFERRTMPRYGVNDPAPVTLDSVVEGMVGDASETGLAIATPYKPVLNSVVRISVHLPGNDRPCDTRAQVVRSASSGQIGLKLLKPESFLTHFENWRISSTEKVGTGYAAAQPYADSVVAAACGAARPQADAAMDAVAEPSQKLEELRAAILQDAERSNLPIYSRTAVIAGVIACAIAAGTMWLWYSRTHKAEANVQASGSPSADSVPAAIPAPVSPTQSTLESAPRPSAADVAALRSTVGVAQSDESTKLAVAPRRTEPQGASHAQIVVNLNRFTQVTPKLLHNPDRIYLDLSPGTRPKISKSSALRAGNPLVRRIRIGHAENGHTRLVLDLRRPCRYHANVSSRPPYRLTINIRADRGRGTS